MLGKVDFFCFGGLSSSLEGGFDGGPEILIETESESVNVAELGEEFS